MIPTVQTQRLTLRAHVLADYEPFAQLFASDRARYLGGPLSRADSWYGFAADTGSWALNGFGCWAVTVSESDRLVGQVGLNHPPHWPERELGWLLLDGHEGQGYAYEAASAARGYAYAKLGWTTVVSYIDPENARSIALAERLGARRDADVTGHDPEDHVYRHPGPEALV